MWTSVSAEIRSFRLVTRVVLFGNAKITALGGFR
jgi:hypothetical protein